MEEDSSASAPAARPTWRRFALLPYLVALCVPLAIVAANPADIPPLPSLQRTLARLLAGTAVAHLCCHAAGWLLRCRPPMPELAVVALQLHLAAYGMLHRLLHEVVQHRILLPAWTLCVGAALWGAWRLSRRRPEAVERMAAALQMGAAVLLLLQVVNVAPRLLAGQAPAATSSPAPQLEMDLSRRPPPPDLPDIYYVILDAYGRQDRLAAFYDYDNAPFLNQLRERGFWVADRACANYHYTRMSLPSSLNMVHLNETPLERFATRDYAHQMINQCDVVKVLNQAGYQTVALADGFAPIEDAAFKRYLTESYAASELDLALLSSTWVLPLLEATRRTSPFDSARQRLLRRFRLLGTLASDSVNADQPLFVFAHILAPHRPFLFDAQGRHLGPPDSFWDGASYRDPTPATRSLYIDGYVGQLQFVNQRVLEVIDAIQQQRRPSIIILQGDHGPGAHMNDPSRRETHVQERLGILFAIGSNSPAHKISLSAEATPVNLFRAIFNRLLKTDLPPLPDRTYYQPTHTAPFQDVTELVR